MSKLPKNTMYDTSVGELIDKLSIINVKMWHVDSAIQEARRKKDKVKAGELAFMARDLNRDRTLVREAINYKLEGYTRGSHKIEYAGVGR